ncbi:RNA-directed DNA polymerase, eukaryota [Tanacetum coccineum]
MFFKVDFAKAYDSVRWDFLIDVLEAFGFGETWCNWVRGTFCHAKGSILVNGSPSNEFQFHCGLKQGDPLSPYLFILVMESLHLSVCRAENDRIFNGIRLHSFFKGAELSEKKITWVAWDKICSRRKLKVTNFNDLAVYHRHGDPFSCYQIVGLRSLSNDGVFKVKDVRSNIDDLFLPSHNDSTRWVKSVPIKINIFAWRARRDCLPTRLNLIRRGVSLESTFCPMCLVGEEDVSQMSFFRFPCPRKVLRRIAEGWRLIGISGRRFWSGWIGSWTFALHPDGYAYPVFV